MAEAKKCDICGRLYEQYNAKIPAKYPNYISFNSEPYYGPSKIIKTYDCCPECMYQIGALIYGLQFPETEDKPEYLKRNFNLPLEKETKDEHN